MTTMHPFAIYYDLQIAQLLVASGAVCFLLLRDLIYAPRSLPAQFPRTTRAIAAVAGAVFLIVLYGSFIEPRMITITRETIALPEARRLEEPVRIAVVSDLHLGPYKRAGFLRRVIRAIEQEKPDIVVMPGDFVYSDDGTDEWRDLTLLSTLATTTPVVAVFGNHDTGIGDEHYFIERKDGLVPIKETLQAAGVRTLENEHILFSSANHDALAIVGLTEFRTNRTNHLDALRGIPPEVPRVVVAHNPGVIRFLDPTTTDLVIAGHTHNGQVRLPFLPPLVHIPTPLGQRFDAGLFIFNHIPLFITRGIGESGPRARLFNPPEIAVLTIQ